MGYERPFFYTDASGTRWDSLGLITRSTPVFSDIFEVQVPAGEIYGAYQAAVYADGDVGAAVHISGWTFRDNPDHPYLGQFERVEATGLFGFAEVYQNTGQVVLDDGVVIGDPDNDGLHYPPDMRVVRVELDGGFVDQNQKSHYIRERTVEFFHGMGAFAAPSQPTTDRGCPPDPPWPYRDPDLAVAPGPQRLVRRSTP